MLLTPDGALTVVEPVDGSGTGGVAADYAPRLTRQPMANVTIRVSAQARR